MFGVPSFPVSQDFWLRPFKCKKGKYKCKETITFVGMFLWSWCFVPYKWYFKDHWLTKFNNYKNTITRKTHRRENLAIFSTLLSLHTQTFPHSYICIVIVIDWAHSIFTRKPHRKENLAIFSTLLNLHTQTFPHSYV